MPALPTPGLQAAKRATTGRLYFKPTPAGGPATASEIDLGNVVKWKRNDRTETLDHLASVNGVRMVDDTIVHTLGFGYVFTLDEYTTIVLELLQKAAPGALQPTASAAAGTDVTLVDVVLGRSYPIGPEVGVKVSAVKVGAVAKNSWSFNKDTGRLTILAGGDIAANDDVIVTYEAAGASFTRHASGVEPSREGTFVFVETDQLSTTPRAIHRWAGVMWVNGDAEQTMDAFGTLELNCTCRTAPTVDERQN
ncbi:MAG: hypothetical protein J0L84_00375 [Verrucomicrobia bacterium]|nr:hypothetical protein [Verrucomicrobiota bacterium]